MKKWITAMLSMLCVCLMGVGLSACEKLPIVGKYFGGEIEYALSDDGTYARVIGYEGMAKRVRIADTYKGVPVTVIGHSAFAYCSSLTSVVIGDSVTSIGEQAFCDCSSLTSVVIGDSVTSIGDYAFWYCDSLTSVVIPDSVTSIGEGAFAWCSDLTKVYYKGTASEWEKISIGSNDYLIGAARYYYSESQPTTSGNYWHYDEDGNVVVW